MRHETVLSYRGQVLWERLRRSLRRDAEALTAGLRDPLWYLVLFGAFLLAALAYRAERTFLLEIGERPEEAFIEGLHAPERAGPLTFRWSGAEGRIRIPGWGIAPQQLTLMMAAPRPTGGPPPRLRLYAGGRPLAEFTVGPQPQVYHLLLPRQALLPWGDLDLVLEADTFIPPGDARVLGVVLDRLEVRPAASTTTDAAPLPFLLSGLTAGLAALLVWRLGWGRGAALAVGGGLALALAAGLAWARPLLTAGLPFLPLGIAGAWLFLAIFQGAVRDLMSRGGAPLGRRSERALWSAVAFFLALRLAGSLHPAHETWDLCFHWHNLEAFLRQGRVFFTIISGEWRSQETLYPPTLYILQAPLWGLLEGRLVPFKVTGVVLDTSAALWVAYIARRLLGRGRAASWAAFFYLTMPQSAIIFSWGIVVNILGQWLLLALLAFLLSPGGRLARRRDRAMALVLLVPALLAHPGTVLLTGVFLAGLFLTAWLAPLPPVLPRRTAWRWARMGGLALLLLLLLYYGYFVGTMWGSLQAMAQGANAEEPTAGGLLVRGPVIDKELGLVAVEVTDLRSAVLAGVRELAAEARAYYHTWPFLLALLALPGLALERRPLAVRLLGLALLVAFLFAFLGLAVNLYVRYAYFLLPVVAVGMAWWMARFSRLGRAGRWLSVAIGLYLGGAGLAFWVDHVLFYSAGCR